MSIQHQLKKKIEDLEFDDFGNLVCHVIELSKIELKYDYKIEDGKAIFRFIFVDLEDYMDFDYNFITIQFKNVKQFILGLMNVYRSLSEERKKALI